MTPERPLYERDPTAYQEYLAEGNRTQSRKRVGADVLFRDRQGHILLVDPRYKPDWDLPGGMAEANEPPVDAARREIREELGLTYLGGRLLVVDWVPPHGPWDDSLMFIFDGGVLAAKEQAQISINGDELSAWGFFDAGTAPTMLRPYVWNRVECALRALNDNTLIYLHGGAEADSDTSMQ
jgi:ADP-ribose pyrophosphatase YjhB (NUDIX family)